MTAPPSLPERRYTLMVVPEGGRGSVRQLTVTASQLRRWSLFAAVFGAVLLVVLMFLLSALPRSWAFGTKVEENMALKARLQDIERKLDEVDDALRRLRLYDSQLQAVPPEGFSEAPALPPIPPAPTAPAPDPEAPEETDAPVEAPPAAPRDEGPNLGLEDGDGASLPGDEDGAPLDEPTLEDATLPEDAPASVQWALAVLDRVQRTAAVLRQVMPQAGMLAESAESWRALSATLPSLWPVDGTLTSRFGYRRSPFNRRWTFHSGLDIAAPQGTTVRAPAAGVVTRAEYQSGLGRMVEIDHGHGMKSRFGHNSVMFVSPGDLVTRGQPIAAVGSTGRSTGPHCHYSILVYGELVDPLLYLPTSSAS